VVLNADLSIDSDLKVGKSTAATAVLATFSADNFGFTGDGRLTVQGSVSAFGTIDVDRATDATGLEAQGDLTIQSSGALNVNQEDDATSAAISISGDLSNDGDVNQSTTELTVTGDIINAGTITGNAGATFSAAE
jgi:hypothetical protein